MTGHYGVLIDSIYYPQAEITADSGAGRLREYFNTSFHALLFSVHRTSHWRRIFEGMSRLKGINNQNIFKDELVSSSLSVILSKIVQIDCLTLVRQGHSGIYKFPDPYDWITHEHWFESFRFFQHRLIEELVFQDGINEEEAKKMIKEVFAPFLANFLSRHKVPSLKQPGILNKVQEKVKMLLRSVLGDKYTDLVAFKRRGQALSLHQLRRPSHPFYKDFKEIERVINKEKK